jgi:hypothetical protein
MKIVCDLCEVRSSDSRKCSEWRLLSAKFEIRQMSGRVMETSTALDEALSHAPQK